MPTQDVLSGEGLLSLEVEPEGGMQAFSLAAEASDQQPRNLQFVEGFEISPGLEFWQVAGVTSISGGPTTNILFLAGSRAAAAYITPPAAQTIELQVDFQLGGDRAYQVMGVQWRVVSLISPPSLRVAQETQVIFKDAGGAPLFTSPLCQFTPPDAPGCPFTLPAPGVDGVWSITFLHRTTVPVNAASSTDIYRIGLDDLVVTTSDLVYLPTPTPTETPTATSQPDPCDALDAIHVGPLVDDLIAAIDEANALPLGEARTLCLEPGQTYSIEQPIADFFGPTGLPPIIGSLTIIGQGATLERPGLAGDAFRILAVAQTGNLTLKDVTVQGGLLDINGGAGLLITGGAAHLDPEAVLPTTGSQYSAGYDLGIPVLQYGNPPAAPHLHLEVFFGGVRGDARLNPLLFFTSDRVNEITGDRMGNYYPVDTIKREVRLFERPPADTIDPNPLPDFASYLGFTEADITQLGKQDMDLGIRPDEFNRWTIAADTLPPAPVNILVWRRTDQGGIQDLATPGPEFLGDGYIIVTVSDLVAFLRSR